MHTNKQTNTHTLKNAKPIQANCPLSNRVKSLPYFITDKEQTTDTNEAFKAGKLYRLRIAKPTHRRQPTMTNTPIACQIAGRAIIIALIFVQLASPIGTVTVPASNLGNNATTEPATQLESNETQPNTPTNTTTTAATTTTTSTTSTSTLAAAAETATATPATTELPTQSTTMREPSEQEINEARKIIHEIASTIKEGATRVSLNKPTLSQLQDFAPDSAEARLGEAASQFGLNFINNLPPSPRANVVISPVSMQILLNIILLGTDDQSSSQTELAKVLAYDTNNLLKQQSGTSARNASTTQHNSTGATADSAQPHATMHSLLESISHATHLTIDEQHHQQLLNSNPQLAAALQTTARENGTPLTGQVNFTLANLMLTNKDLVRTNPDYEQDLKRFYDVKLEHFSRGNNNNKSSSDSSQSRPLHERVNGWVRNVTQNQIGELVNEADLAGDDLAMVLLNAAHFKGRWLHTFNTKATHDRLFYNDGQEAAGQEVKFMRQNGVFGYAEFGGGSGGGGQTTAAGGDQPQATGQQTSTSDETVLTEDLAAVRDGDKTPDSLPVIELSKEEAKRYELTSNLNCSALMMPFALNDGQELSMVIVLPSKRDGLQDLLRALNGPALNEIFRSLNEQHVQVELPRFSFESSLDAKETLQKMGLTRIFQSGADLGRMLSSASPKELVKVNKVMHKAKIAVDELGAEAAAASAATIVLRNLIRPPNPSFVADHPFLFVIRHNLSNLPLFMGTIQRL